MLAAVSTQNKILLGGMALVFIVFSLVASFWLPRRNPNFPENRNLFIGITAILFVGMLLAVELFAVEEEEHGGEEQHALISRS